MITLWVPVVGFKNGEDVDDAVLNRPVRQLRDRTEYLRSRLDDAIGEDAFQSLRLLEVPLTMGTADEPVVQDIVYLNTTTQTYAKARAGTNLLSNVFQTAIESSYAIGLLISKAGNTGTVVIAGKITLASGGIDWNLQTMIETGRTFRPGAYYLSAVEAGKMTDNPAGPAIYIGYFLDAATTPAHGGSAVLSPQYKDVGEAHLHRPFAMQAQPAGCQVITGAPPNAVHSITGFQPRSTSSVFHGTHSGVSGTTLIDPLADFTLSNYKDLAIANVTKGTSGTISDNDVSNVLTDINWDNGDEYYIYARSRIVLYGKYTSPDIVTYTLTLTDSTGVEASGAGGPYNGNLGFEDAYLKWDSSDPVEGSGLVRITGYEIPVPFGTKGLYAVIENALSTDWNWIEAANESLARRQWIIQVPQQTQGWLARRFRQPFAAHQTIDGKYSLVLFGDYANTANVLEQPITVAFGALYSLDYTANPNDGDTFTVGTNIYEFDNNDTVVSGNIAVTIATTVEDTYANLLAVMVATAFDGMHAALDVNEDRIATVVPASTVVAASVTNAVLTQVWDGSDTDLSNLPGTLPQAKLLVYDSDHATLIPTLSYWNNAIFNTPVQLNNGLYLMFVPFNTNREPVTDDTVRSGDNWDTVVVDEAPNTKFVYSVGMDSGLSVYYPPTPLQAAALMMNGVEMEAYDIHPDNPVYRTAYGSIYWYDNAYAEVPWPVDWQSYASPGSVNTQVYLTFYMVHMRLGATSTVTSLQPAPGTPLKVYRCGTNTPATTGDLMVALELALADVDANTAGYKVVKEVQGNKFMKGPVVERIQAGPGVTITVPPGTPDGQGVVTIAAGEGYDGIFDDIVFQNAKQEVIGLFPYTRLLGWTQGSANNVGSGFTATFQLPITLQGEFQIAVYLTVFGEADIPYIPGGSNSRKNAGLSLTYSVLRNFSPNSETYGTLQDNLITPVSPRTVEIPFGVATGIAYPDMTRVYKAYDPMIVHNNPADTLDQAGKIVRCLGGLFPVVGDLKGTTPTTLLSEVTAQAGSFVGIRVTRAGVADPANHYSNYVGFTVLRWRLVRVA